MNKRFRSILCTLLAVILLAGMLPMSAAAVGSTPFTDVASTDWFATPVLWAVDHNITGGIGNGKFGPNNPCTRAQVVTFLWAAEGKPEPRSSINPFKDVPNNAWYLKPVLWAVENGITGGTSNNTFSPEKECTRAEIVTFLYAAADRPAISSTKSDFLDVVLTDWFAKPVIWAKENEITGGTSPNTFGPLNVCTRGQIVTFLYKAYSTNTEPTPTTKPTITPTPTPTPTPPSSLSAEQIYAKCSSAVFYIQIFDRYGDLVSSGSGVFLTADGLAITNHHVIADAYSAKIMTNDGKTYNVSGYYDAKAAIDLALIQVEGSGFNYLELGNSQGIAGGQNIFAIGSPKGLDNTISTGIISNPKRVIDGMDYIQITAPISPGSSGGALINDKGQLIGITTAVHASADAQNINLAVPIYHKDELSTNHLNTLPLGSGTPTDYGASIRFNSTLSVTKGSSGAVSITCNPGSYPYPDDVSVYFEPANESIASAEWGEWNELDVELFVYGNSPGTTTFDIYLLDANDMVLASGVLTVIVNEPIINYGASMSFDSSMDLTLGNTGSLMINIDRGSYNGYLSVVYDIADENIVSAQWGEWSGDNVELFINGDHVGSTTVTVDLLTDDDVWLASETVTVTVNDVPTTEQTHAFNALANWISSNYTDVMSNGELCYISEETIDGSLYQYMLALTNDQSRIALGIGRYDGSSQIYTYIDLLPNAKTSYSEIYCIINQISADTPVFEGAAYIDQETFNAGTTLQLVNIKGDAGSVSNFANIMKYMILMGLEHVNSIYNTYINSYTVKDLGFKSAVN